MNNILFLALFAVLSWVFVSALIGFAFGVGTVVARLVIAVMG